ncbi:MAG TPA: tRNA lysidine(34) synthetase TilS [Bacteroidales bacterium]|nr:tRNA lysidine(34) synthetase TilS [Bacteroidales bacterium]
MVEAFKHKLKEFELSPAENTVMLAVSGGIDSVVLTDLFAKSRFPCIILHCNFDLRGEESDGDEAFVRTLAAKYDFPVFVKRFATKDYAFENSISIQMAARELRYRWFDEIAKEQKVDIIATGHNMNDSVETVLNNLSRGTGIKGITGIPMGYKNYIRPLLFASREEIRKYASEAQLQFRDDSSNKETKYTRNKIRHNIIPSFESINPSFIKTMKENIDRFGEIHDIYREYVLIRRNQLFFEKGDHIEVDLEGLLQLQPRSSWLYELFNDFGFSRDQCLSIEKILASSSGKQFVSPTHRLFKDRDNLLLFPVEETAFDRFYIDSPESKASVPFSLDIEVINREELSEIPDNSKIACIDLEKMNFPLIIRKWQHGDFFYPLGMDHIKKVSDFFIDNKVPVPVKEKTWIFTSGNKLVWIAGFRIDNRFRITDKTTKVLKMQLYD